MAARRKLIVVSNRGPVSFTRDEEGNRVTRRGGGGLVTALRSFVAHHDVTWIASAMSVEDRAVADESGGEAVDEVARDGSPYRLRLVAHDPVAYDWFYNVVANPTLWFLQHYLWALAYAPDIDPGLYHAWEDGYVPVNRNFADAALAELEAQPDAAVFFHDYHLYLAPRFVREAKPDAPLAHFVHIPWPEPNIWRVLPEPIRNAIHDGLLANDVVGLHAHRWRRSFLRSSRDLLDADCDFDRSICSHAGGRTFVAARPISVDPSEFEDLADGDEVRRLEAELESDRPEILVLRVDRTDPSKNVVRGFRAFEFYLDAHPEMHGRVGMLALLDPSRQEIPEYAEYLGAIQRAARAVNDRFQREGWMPDRPADRGRLPAFCGRVQAVRRAARERDLRRAEPRREGGAARERARRRPDPVRECRGARRARAVGADGQSVRHRGAVAGDRGGDRDVSGGAARTHRVDSRARALSRRLELARDAARGPGPVVGEGGSMSDLSHVDETGEVRMVDVGGKDVSRRRAVAHASLRMAPATARRLRELPKGDALAAAQIAGIMAAKRTSELIPLCHPASAHARRRRAVGRRDVGRDHGLG